MLSKIESLVKKRVQSLLQKLNDVNKLIWAAQKEGYKLELECWGRSLGTKGTGNKISLEATWRTYRIDLRDVTDDYRTNADPAHADFTKGTSDLDAFADDLSDFSAWPTEPT